jgi:UDP-GlcNAc:undecaprenyl-phosphate/decaprenyl-phosphate GlcNAc-1-phosphate transferase
MSDWVVAAIVGAALGGIIALVLAPPLIASAPPALIRVNYRDRRLPVVLGLALATAALLAVTLAMLAVDVDGELVLATMLVLAVLGAGGLADDLHGDERAKGFRGHITAALRGRITGGFLKMVAGGIAGVAAGFIVSSGRTAIEIALLVALTANLINLLDRAPGRAAKVSLIAALPLLWLGAPGWAVASAGVWGSAAGILPFDLRERGMLGDTGANPLGGVLGLGLGLSLSEPWRLVALAIVLGLNLASEKVSFSRVIERTPLLRALDGAGRAKLP